MGLSMCVSEYCKRKNRCWRAIGVSPNSDNQAYCDLSYVCINDDYHFFSEVDGRPVREVKEETEELVEVNENNKETT